MRLAVPLPDVAIKVIEIVGGDVGNAVQLKEVCLRGQSPEEKQQRPHDRQVGNGSVPNDVRMLLPPFILPGQDAGGGPIADGSVSHHSQGSRGGAIDSLFGHVRRFALIKLRLS